jgi:hypothetical protein
MVRFYLFSVSPGKCSFVVYERLWKLVLYIKKTASIAGPGFAGKSPADRHKTMTNQFNSEIVYEMVTVTPSPESWWVLVLPAPHVGRP